MARILNDDRIILDGHKLLWHRDRVEAWLSDERVAPITVDMALTTACTYNCIYWCRTFQQNEGFRLSRDVIYRFLDDSAEIGVKAISIISDGENTLSPHIYDTIIKGQSNGLDMALGTNGFSLADERLEDILSRLTYIRFNISAASQESYMRIHGVPPEAFQKVIGTIKKSVAIKKRDHLNVTIGLQMVLMPHYSEEILPLTELGSELQADYLVIKHCSDDELGTLGVDYSQYERLIDTLKEAENKSNSNYLVRAKWSKILSRGQRDYAKCYGPPLVLELSGTGLVAPCGFHFNSKFKEKFHIGNIAERSFKEIWQSERYWEVMAYLQSDEFDARKDCGTLCMQHKANEFLWKLKNGVEQLVTPKGPPPMHLNFI
jgi:MoaA/NifB/PqqE/SkfB family radical SAM enzyme